MLARVTAVALATAAAIAADRRRSCCLVPFIVSLSLKAVVARRIAALQRVQTDVEVTGRGWVERSTICR